MHGLYLTTILMQILLLIPDLLLRPDTSILRIHILVCGLVIYVDKFIWPCGLASCLSAVLSQGSNCQYPDSMFPRTISPPGCLLRFLEHSCFSAFAFSLGKLPIHDAKFLSVLEPLVSRLDLPTWTSGNWQDKSCTDSPPS